MDKRVALTLPSGGTATTRGKYAPYVKKQVPPCDWTAVGPLPKGDYTLRLLTPLFFQARTDVAPRQRPAEGALRVGR